MKPLDYHDWMQQALKEAEKAVPIDVPVGAVVVTPEGVCIGRGFNTRERDQNPLGHAELNALLEASQAVSSWRLSDCTLFVTLEPCPMCASAINQARIKQVVFGSHDPDFGGCGGWVSVHQKPNPSLTVIGGILEAECAELLAGFFKKLRLKRT
jgi:tRNA(adenine34) deaminase